MVERSVNGGPWVVIARGVSATTYEDTDLWAGTTYRYAIMATSAAGISAPGASAAVQTASVPAPTGSAPAPAGPVADSLASQPLIIEAIRRQLFSGVVATFADANVLAVARSFVATIHWGDGRSSRGTVTGSDGHFLVVGQHRYAAAGRYTIRVAVTMSAPSRAATSIVSTATVSRPLRVLKRTAGLHQALARRIRRS
jgi:hypothetical protein